MRGDTRSPVCFPSSYFSIFVKEIFNGGLRLNVNPVALMGLEGCSRINELVVFMTEKMMR